MKLSYKQRLNIFKGEVRENEIRQIQKGDFAGLDCKIIYCGGNVQVRLIDDEDNMAPAISYVSYEDLMGN